MANDKGPSMEIPVSAYSVKGSGEKAINDLINETTQALKKHSTDVSIKTKVSFDDKKFSKEFVKAHEDLFGQLDKASAKGFSLSEKELNTLLNKYKKFISIAGKEGKSDLPQVKKIKNTLGNALKPYNDYKIELKKINAATKKENKKLVEQMHTIDSKKRSLFKPSKDKGVHALAKKLGYPTDTSYNKGVATPDTARESEGSPYRNNWMQAMAKSRREAKKDERRSLKTWRELNYKFDEDSLSYNGRGRATTKDENDSFLATKSLKELGRMIVKMDEGSSDITSDNVIEQLGVVINLFKNAGHSLEESLESVKNMIESPYSDKPTRRLGGTEGDIKLPGLIAKDTMKMVYDILDGVWKAASPAIKELKEFSNELNGATNLLKQRSTYAMARETAKTSDEYNLVQAVAKSLDKTTSAMYAQSVRESSREGVADEKQSAIDLVNKNTNVSALKIAAKDAEDGFNSENNTNLLIRKQQASNSIAGQSQNILDQISASLGVEEQNSKKKDTNVTVLTQIRDLLQALCRRLLPGSDITSDTVDNKRRITGRKKDPTLGSSERDITGIRSSKPDVIELPTAKSIATTTQPENNLPALTEHGVVDVGAIEKERKLREREQRLNDAKAKSLELEKQIEHDRKKYFSDKLRQQLKEQREAHQAEVKQQIIERLRNRPNERKPKTTKSQVDVLIETTFLDKLKKVLTTSPLQSEAERIMKLNEEEQERMRAERINKFGLNRGKSLSDTGDIAQVKRTKSLFGWNYNRDKDNKELFNDIKLTEGLVEIDTKKIMEGLDKVLTGPEMFKAQTGGVLRNVIGSMTGYIGMPSIEKSRAKAEGLNQVMSNVRNEILTLIQDIQSKESTLRGMEQSGAAIFSKSGKLLSGNSAAQKTLDDLEEQKQALAAALAETRALDKVIASCGGKVDKIVKRIGFVMPELRQNNVILKNIGAGLDKNGKALKFQSRTAEILNYTFQLMSRHIGQVLKNWLMMINPLVQIKKLFNDFMSYDVKWQRTMNVIKYNLRAIVKPMMQWIAQKLVNIIGFFDIILMKIQEAFGRTPISLFDQSAADAEKMKEQLEEATNVSAGFDELHDISGETGGGSAAENLFGDIYKPQLSPEWKQLAEDIGNLFKGLITGDLGFGEVMQEILRILGEALVLIGKTIWDWFKNSGIGKYIIDNWKSILDTLLRIFLAWQLLKIGGKLLWNALTGQLTGTAFAGVLSKLGAALMAGFSKIGAGIAALFAKIPFAGAILKGIGSFAGGLALGIKGIFNGVGLIDSLKIAFTSPSLVAELGGWGSMLGMIFAQALVGAAGIGIGVTGIMKGFDMNADAASYNIGLAESGGNSEDKKSYLGGTLTAGALGAVGGTITGAALAGLATGGPIGAAVGAIAGILIASLAPAFEEVAVSARNANNEMQKIEYYQAIVQGYSTEVGKLTEMERLLKDTLDLKVQSTINEGVQLGHNRDRMIELTNAVLNGTYSTDMLSSSEQNLTEMLANLSAQQEKNKAATEKLEAAKRKLQKAELDLAIAEDVAAGNFELAAARVEYALAAELYEIDEATKKMTQIIKEGSAEQAAAILQDLSPEMQKNFDTYYSKTDAHINELLDLYYNYSKSEREYFLQNLTPEVEAQMRSRVEAIRREVENAPWYMRLMDIGNDGKILGMSYVNVPGYEVGTNYVPSDGLAYLHKGEAVIPAKYNEGIGIQGKAYQEQAIANTQLLNSIVRLESIIKQGIPVSGQFVQRGSDLVAVVNRTKSQTGADLLSNVSYAR